MYDRQAVIFGMLRLIVPERENGPATPTRSPRRLLKEQRRLGAVTDLRLMTNETDPARREDW